MITAKEANKLLKDFQIHTDIIHAKMKDLDKLIRSACVNGDSNICITIKRDHLWNIATVRLLIENIEDHGYTVATAKVSQDEADAGYMKRIISWVQPNKTIKSTILEHENRRNGDSETNACNCVSSGPAGCPVHMPFWDSDL